MISHCVQISLIWQGCCRIQTDVHACVAKPLPAGPFPWSQLFIYHMLKPAQSYYVCNKKNCFFAFWFITTLECTLLMERARGHFCGFPFSYLFVSELFNKEIVIFLTVLEYLLCHKLGQNTHDSGELTLPF